jgi:hypothetical protein
MTQHDMHAWKDDEYGYCAELVAFKGNDNIGRNPRVIAQYLRLQASSAFRDGEYELSARLGTAATAISESADNNHAPNWLWAEEVVEINL